MLTIMELYRENRKPSFAPYNEKRLYMRSAKSALQGARWRINAEKTRKDFDANENVRLHIVPDEVCSYEDLDGDTFNPIQNPDIKPEILAREEQREHDRIDRDGVWGVVGEYFDGEKWQHADSCFGFVGDDWENSGYEIDIMAATLESLKTVHTCECCGRPKL